MPKKETIRTKIKKRQWKWIDYTLRISITRQTTTRFHAEQNKSEREQLKNNKWDERRIQLED